MDRYGNRITSQSPVDVDSLIHAFAGGRIKDTLPLLIKISGENHKYLEQWKNIRWDLSTVKNLVGMIKKFELNDLQLQGKGIWALEKIFEFGGKESPELQQMKDDEDFTRLLHETLLKILFEFTLYNQIIDIFRLLVKDYGFQASKIFAIGSTIVDKIPGLINDDCYIALIHFATECSRLEPTSIVTAMPFLASGFSLIGCDSNASYFLYRSIDFLVLGLTIYEQDYFLTLNPSEEFRQEIKDKTITYTLNFLKCLGTIQPSNARYIFNTPELFNAIVAIIDRKDLFNATALKSNNPSILSLSARELVLREAISTVNALVVDDEIRSALKVTFTLPKLISLVELNYLAVNEMIVELYLLLYECDLPYIYEEQKYSPIGSAIDQQFFSSLFQSLIITLQLLFPSNVELSPPGEDSLPSSPTTASVGISSTQVIKCNFIYRLLFKVEASLHLVSDITQFTHEKLILLQIILPIFQRQPPSEWNLYYINLIDIILLIFKGCEYCWEIPKIDLLDAEFLHISNQLIYQFGQDHIGGTATPPVDSSPSSSRRKESNIPPVELNKHTSNATTAGILNNNKFFDSKDRNSLYYLIGYDNLSTIPEILRKSFDQRAESSSNTTDHSGSFTPSKFQSLSRKNTFTREEIDNLNNSADYGKPEVERNAGNLSEAQNEIQRYYENATKLSTIEQYQQCIQLFKSFKEYLLSHVTILDKIIVNWELHSIETNCRKLLYFYLISNFIDLQSLLKKVYESNLFYDLLWRLINQQQPPPSSSTSKLPIFGKNNTSGKGGERVTSVDNLYNIKSIYGMNRKCIQLLTILIREKGSFEESVHFAEFLHLVLTTRPERLREITTNAAPATTRDTVSENVEKERSLSEADNDLLLQSRDNVSIFANLAFRMSSVDLLSIIDTSLPQSPGHSTNSPTYSHHPSVIIEDIVNLDIHYTAVSAMLALSHFDRTVRRKMITYATNIIESLNFICPNDPINYKPMIYLVKSMIEFIAKLELVNEETIIGLIVRGLKSPLLYVKSQICDLIYYIGIENPGFIYRGLSRNEVEEEIIKILSTTNSENAILLLNALKASCVIIHNINLKPIWIPVNWLYHWSKYPKNNMPLTYLISLREFISVKTLLLIISLLKNCPKYYRLVYFTHILSFASSLMYACVEGIIPNTSPPVAPGGVPLPSSAGVDPSIGTVASTSISNESMSNNSGTATGSHHQLLTSVLTPPSQFIRETLIQHVLPFVPIAIDFIMTLGKKFSKQRKSVTHIENPLRFESVVADADDSGTGSNNGASPRSNNGGVNSNNSESILPPGLPESYSQIIANRFYHNNDKKFNLWLLLQDIQQATGGSSSPTAVPSADGLISLELLQSLIAEKLSTNPQYFLQDNTTYYPASVGKSSPLPPPPPSSPSLSVTSSKRNGIGITLDKSTGNIRKVSPSQLLTIFKSKPIESLTEKTIDCIYSFLCTDEMFPLSTYLQHIALFQTNPVIASLSYFMTEHRQNSVILKRGLDCIKYFADNQMHLSLIAMHSPLALIYTVKHMKDVLDIQISFVKIIFMITQINDDFAKENLIRFNIHYLLIEMIHSQHYELSKIALQCTLALLTNDTNTITIAQNTGLIESISALLDSSINKDIKIQYYGMKILLVIDEYAPELISHSTKNKSLFLIMKKSRKCLINYMKTNFHYYYQNNIFQKTLVGSNNSNNNSTGGGGGSGSNPGKGDGESVGGVPVNAVNGSAGGSPSAAGGGGTSGKGGFASLSDTIEKNDIEELLNNPLWQKEKCVVM